MLNHSVQTKQKAISPMVIRLLSLTSRWLVCVQHLTEETTVEPSDPGADIHFKCWQRLMREPNT